MSKKKPIIRFPIRPIVCSISDLAAEAEKAFINLNAFPINVCGKSFWLPPLFISDGMSIPDIAQSKMQGEDGITAGHLHDMLYCKRFNKETNEIASLLDLSPRRAADKMLREYLDQHCPGFRKIESKEVDLSLRFFGGFCFQNEEQDIWRSKVAKRLFDKAGEVGDRAGDGCGVDDRNIDLYERVSLLEAR